MVANVTDEVNLFCYTDCSVFFSGAQQDKSGLSRLIVEVSETHTNAHTR